MVKEVGLQEYAAARYPGWHVEWTGPDTMVLTGPDQGRAVITCRRRRRINWMQIVMWAVPAVIVGMACWMMVVMGLIAFLTR